MIGASTVVLHHIPRLSLKASSVLNNRRRRQVACAQTYSYVENSIPRLRWPQKEMMLKARALVTSSTFAVLRRMQRVIVCSVILAIFAGQQALAQTNATCPLALTRWVVRRVSHSRKQGHRVQANRHIVRPPWPSRAGLMWVLWASLRAWPDPKLPVAVPCTHAGSVEVGKLLWCQTFACTFTPALVSCLPPTKGAFRERTSAHRSPSPALPCTIYALAAAW